MVEEVETRAGGKAVDSRQTWGTLTLGGDRMHVKCQEERKKHEKLNKIEGIRIRDFYVVSSPSSSFRIKLTAVATHLETLDKILDRVWDETTLETTFLSLRVYFSHGN